jgi:hypothetical protein
MSPQLRLLYALGLHPLCLLHLRGSGNAGKKSHLASEVG